jgi:hypothetical protein
MVNILLMTIINKIATTNVGGDFRKKKHFQTAGGK